MFLVTTTISQFAAGKETTNKKLIVTISIRKNTACVAFREEGERVGSLEKCDVSHFSLRERTLGNVAFRAGEEGGGEAIKVKKNKTLVAILKTETGTYVRSVSF